MLDFIYNSDTILAMLGLLYLGSIIHIVASKRVTESAKLYWVIAAVVIPFLPYLLWRMVATASPTDSLTARK